MCVTLMMLDVPPLGLRDYTYYVVLHLFLHVSRFQCMIHGKRLNLNPSTVITAGYLHMIHQMRELITQAGKKSYTFVMGRPNPAKLANFPEVASFCACCDYCLSA